MAEAAEAVLAAAFLFAVELGLNAFAFWAGRTNRARSLEALPRRYGVGVLLTVLFVHLGALLIAFSALEVPSRVFWLAMLLWASAFFMAARIAAESIGAPWARAVFYTDTITEATRYAEIDACESGNDLEGAIAACDTLITTYATDAEPYFRKATFLETLERYEDAGATYEQTRTTFAESPLVWRKATLRLADLNESYLAKPDRARELRSQAEERVPTRT